MFVISSTYTRPLDDRKVVEEHLAFIKQSFDEGLFIAAGGRPAGVGGVIVARGDSEEELRSLMRQDPFVREGYVAEYEFLPFRASMAAYDELVEA